MIDAETPGFDCRLARPVAPDKLVRILQPLQAD